MKRRTFLGIVAWAVLGWIWVVGAPELRAGYTLVAGHAGNGGGVSTGGGYTLIGVSGDVGGGLSQAGRWQLHGGFGGVLVSVEIAGGLTGFFAWMENLPPEQRPPEGLRGPEDQPAGDGLGNLYKYLVGLLPLVPSAEAAPQLATVGGFLALELSRRPDAEASLLVEGSQDLVEWARLTHDEDVLESTGDLERIRLVTPLEAGAAERWFVRLRVRLPED
ncbi:MAG: hypothetical protein EA425_11775 [Puniceicoccaceae bacterium]|nr:MAG: hypothetical protein EA425_11775 [Puniceicoccaceae bacterium]